MLILFFKILFSGVAKSSVGVYITDFQNNRILYFPDCCGGTGGPNPVATLQYGQVSFTSYGVNTPSLSGQSLGNAFGIAVDLSDNLYACDFSNNRVLFYPFGSNTPSRVYGQPNYTTNAPNNGGPPSASSLKQPQAVAIDNARNIVYIVDSGNHRVLKFNGNSTVAIGVFGQQGSFVSNIVYPTSASSLFFPRGVAVDSTGAVYVSDTGNNRILYYEYLSYTASNVYGQAFFSNRRPNQGLNEPTAFTLYNSLGVHVGIDDILYVADTKNSRVLRLSGSCFCVPGYYSATGMGPCLPCPAGSFGLSTFGGSICTPCGAGTFSSIVGATTSGCLPCSMGGTYSAGGASICSVCPAGSFVANNVAGLGNLACSSCFQGSWSAAAASNCTLCGVGSASSVIGAPSEATCVLCLPGFYAPTPGMAACIPCPSGYYSSLPGAVSPASCISCPVNFFSSVPGSATCLPCPPGSSAAAGSAVCTICPPGQVPNNTSPTGCWPCMAGQFSSLGGSSTCQTCPSGSWAASGASECTLCAAGMYLAINGGTNASQCTPCNSGTYSPFQGSSSCTSCPAGYFSNATNSSTCGRCSKGFYSSFGASSCLPCPPGLVALSEASASCGPCPSGNIPDVSTGNCTVCPPGSFAPFGATTCIQCSSGSYSEFSNSSSCTPCANGYYSAFQGANSSIHCLPCSPGYYGIGIGQSACQPCAVGYFSNVTAATTNTCERCKINTFSSSVGSGSCSSCGPGLVALTEGQSQCFPCGSGSVSFNFTCKQCDAGSYATEGAVNCTLCNAGSYSNTTGRSSCEACPLGTYSALAGGNNE